MGSGCQAGCPTCESVERPRRGGERGISSRPAPSAARSFMGVPSVMPAWLRCTAYRSGETDSGVRFGRTPRRVCCWWPTARSAPAAPLEMDALAGSVGAALPGVAVEVGYLEMTEPPAGPVVDHLVAAGCRRVVVLPLVLLERRPRQERRAGGRASRPGTGIPEVDVSVRSPLGSDPGPGGAARPGGSGVGRGRAAPAAGRPRHVGPRRQRRGLQGRPPDRGMDGSRVCLRGVQRGDRPVGARGRPGLRPPRLRPHGGGLVVPVPREADRAGPRRPGPLRRANRGGDRRRRPSGRGPALVPLVVERYSEALAGAVDVNCDTCAYRAPWPGREDRVGQAIGVGHSHLAVDHRHYGHGHRH